MMDGRKRPAGCKFGRFLRARRRRGGDTMTQAAHSEHAGPKSSLGSDDSERIASQFSLMYTTYSHIARACLRRSWYPLPCVSAHIKNYRIAAVVFYFKNPFTICASASSSVSPSVISLIICSPAILPMAASWIKAASK